MRAQLLPRGGSVQDGGRFQPSWQVVQAQGKGKPGTRIL
jgi:hypothetical protein